MALNEFFVEPAGAGASDTNAGSTTGGAFASATNGAWNQSTSVYTAGGGGKPVERRAR